MAFQLLSTLILVLFTKLFEEFGIRVVFEEVKELDASLLPTQSHVSCQLFELAFDEVIAVNVIEEFGRN